MKKNSDTEENRDNDDSSRRRKRKAKKKERKRDFILWSNKKTDREEDWEIVGKESAARRQDQDAFLLLSNVPAYLN